MFSMLFSDWVSLIFVTVGDTARPAAPKFREVFGEGAHQARGGAFGGAGRLDARDVRFTRNKAGDVVYAIVLGWPDGDFVVNNLGTDSTTQPGKIENLELLGSHAKLDWNQSAKFLTVKKPTEKPCDFACAFKVSLA